MRIKYLFIFLVIAALFSCSEKQASPEIDPKAKKEEITTPVTDEKVAKINEATKKTTVPETKKVTDETKTPSAVEEKVELTGLISGLRYPLEVTTPAGMQTLVSDGVFKVDVDKESFVLLTLASQNPRQHCSVSKNNFIATEDLSDVHISCISATVEPMTAIHGTINGLSGSLELELSGQKKT